MNVSSLIAREGSHVGTSTGWQLMQQPSTSRLVVKGSKIPRDEFERLTTDQLIAYFSANGLTLDKKEKKILGKQKITGHSLLGMTKEDLERYGIPGGTASSMLRMIPPEINGEFISCLHFILQRVLIQLFSFVVK